MTTPVVFDEIEPGLELPVLTYEVTSEAVDAYVRATKDPSPRYRADARTRARRPAPPTFSAVYLQGTRGLLPAPPGGIHAEQHAAFHRPVFVGDVLTIRTRVVDKYRKKERRYVVVETHVTNQDGEPVSTNRAVRIWAR